MARLPVMALVLAGLVVGVAALWRAHREPRGSRAPWVGIGFSSLIGASFLGHRGWQALGETGAFTPPTAVLIHQVAQLATVPLVVMSLLSLPHPPLDRRRLTQTAIDSCVAAIGFGIVYWEVVLPVSMPSGLPSLETSIAVVQAASAVAISTTCAYVLARARQPGGLPFASLGPLAGGILLHVIGLGLLQVALPPGPPGSSGLPGYALALGGLVLAAVGAIRRTSGPETPRTSRSREVTAALTPVVPLVLAGALVFSAVAQGRPVQTPVLVLTIGLLVALLVGAVLTRLESLEVSRTLEDRVAERTLTLGTREKWFRALVSNASDVVTVIDREGIIRYQTPSARRILGHNPEALIGHPFSRLLPASEDVAFAGALAEALTAPEGEARVELMVWRADGQYVETETTVTALLDDPDVRGLVLTTRDVSEHHEMRAALTSQAYSDHLTGLANRTLFRERIDAAVEDASSSTVAVLFLDLDGFKGVNDAQGHSAGDQLLALVGQRLSNAVRPSDIVARLGGDEFGVLVVGDEVEKSAIWVAHRIRRVLANDFRLDGHEITVGASVGIAVNVCGEESADQLLRNADLAMYRAKAEQKQAFVVFEEQMHDAAVARLSAENDLRRAVTRGELVLHYQPIVDLASMRVTGAEALIRWRHPSRGLLPPQEFIGLAEETGLVEDIGAWALDEGCRAAARWQPYGSAGGHFRIAINVSVRQLNAGLPRRVRDSLVKSGLAPGALTLEMTESVLMERTDEMVALLKRFKLLGVRLAVDDFGTGYSSLSYLSRFPVDVLKIDRSFVEQVGRESEKAELARTIVQLGKALRLTTVAEGVETTAQSAALLAMGCDLGQGFLFAPPLPEADLDAYLREAGGNVVEPLLAAESG